MAELFMRDKKEDQAINCLQKALKLLKKLYGTDNFIVIECYLSLVQVMESVGKKQEADQLFQECLDNFDQKDKEGDGHSNDSFDSGVDLSEKLRK